jgi:hypothetical protein
MAIQLEDIKEFSMLFAKEMKKLSFIIFEGNKIL